MHHRFRVTPGSLTEILLTAKVFELCLAEIEKRKPNNQAEAKGTGCTVM